MPLRKSPEQKAQAEAIWQQRHLEEQQRRQRLASEEARAAFYATPAGRARVAYERGDRVFQYSLNVMSQQAIIVAMVGSNVAQRTADPSVILNSVCNEGWDLVNGSFTFIETGQQSRDKFMSSGQNVAVSGATVGYYLFRRCEENRTATPAEPWQEGGGNQLPDFPDRNSALDGLRPNN